MRVPGGMELGRWLAGATALASAGLLGWAVLGEALSPRQVAGMFVIGAGLLLIDGRLVRRAAG